MQRHEIVYSTDDGCAKCRSHPCVCAASRAGRASAPGGKGAASSGRGPSAPSGKAVPGTLRMRFEKSGRGGKVVTVVFDLPADAAANQALCKDLKTRCGSGGTLKDRVIEIQGDHRDRVEALLIEKGFKVKRAGG